MQVRLLGPVDVTADGVPRPVSGLRRKAVLAVLALHRGEIASTNRLVDAVWGDAAPPTAVNTLQSHVSHLRQVLGGKATIRTQPPGYLLDLGPDGTDVEVAERLIRAGSRSTEPAERVSYLRAALALWRGHPLVDVSGLAWLDEQAQRLSQLRLSAQQALVEARLALGEHAAVLPELEQLTLDHPFDEPLHRQLMLALYRAGRQADALAAYHRLRRALAHDLGIDPGQSLRDLEAAILRQDAALAPALPPPADPAGSTGSPGGAAGQADGTGPTRAGGTGESGPPALHRVTAPRQLPPAVPGFAGRQSELAGLDALLPADQPGPAAATSGPVVVLAGTAGIGKTALAVHWAHQVADRFPDGQLYVNLRGFDQVGAPMEPAEAIRGFLAALGVPADRAPTGLDSQTALYRSLLAGKRVLVVLDNARDANQLRPLLPSSAGSAVLVTSRSQLTPLVATAGARPLTLDPLTVAESRDLLSHRLGPNRVSAEPQAAAEIIARCARVPLALAIVAARAATRPGFPLTALASELSAATGTADTLDAFDGGDATVDLRSVLSWSYRTLSDPAARLFRLLGLQPGPDIGTAAAASLAGLPVAETRRLLTELTRAHLLGEPAPGRYAGHDLLRAYAAEQARGTDDEAARRAAVHRALDHYLHTADAAALLLHPHRDQVRLADRADGVVVESLPDRAAALAWFSADRPVLLAAVEQALAAGFDHHTWQLSRCLVNYLNAAGRWDDIAASQQAAMTAATRLADRTAQAAAHRSLAGVHMRLGQLGDAQSHLQQALELSAADGDHTGEAHSQHYLAMLADNQDRPADALRHAYRAHELYRLAGHHTGQATALNATGWYHVRLGDYQQALTQCARALLLQQWIGDRASQAETQDSMGYAHHHLRHYAQAISCYQRALSLFREFGDRYLEAGTLTRLGDTQRAAGEPAAARDAWQRALAILTELDHPDADQVRAKLHDLDRPTATVG